MQRRSLRVQMQQKKGWNNSGCYRIWTIDWYWCSTNCIGKIFESCISLNFFSGFFLPLHRLLLSSFCLIFPLAQDQAPWWDKKQKTGWKGQKTNKRAKQAEQVTWEGKRRRPFPFASPPLGSLRSLANCFCTSFHSILCLFFPTKEPGPRLFFPLQFIIWNSLFKLSVQKNMAH